ncbi:hypothetical protein J2S17_005281 [Cytobacillus purgationiresistens]|uniref:Transposase n=1 Tax=Cytobacillus purgationiresistens TaxID=863449 RepID=A0ABU0AR54_9BACI|nr:hypothetical protein [Cytobacillus purgationiresistens]
MYELKVNNSRVVPCREALLEDAQYVGRTFSKYRHCRVDLYHIKNKSEIIVTYIKGKQQMGVSA